MSCENNFTLENILEKNPLIRGGCHFCLMKNDISTYVDLLSDRDLENSQKEEIIQKYIVSKHTIDVDTFSNIYSFMGYR